MSIEQRRTLSQLSFRLLSAAKILFVTLAAASFAFVGGCRQANQFVPPPPPAVTVAKPLEKPVNDTIEFVGTTQATQSVELRSQVKGYLEKINFEDGSNVKQGDLLFVIEQPPYQVALDSAKAALQKAISSQALAESTLRRMERAGNAVTAEEVDIQRAQVATSKADVASAEAELRRAQLNMNYTQIRSPINGRIGQHMVDVGNLVQAQDTPLATVQTLDPIYAQFDLSENDLLRFMEMLRRNQLPDPERYRPVLHLGLPNEQGFPHEGKLDYRELRVDQSTGTVRRRGIFPNPGWQLIPGMFVRIQASIGEPKPRLLVEERAIGTDQRGDYLLVVNDKNSVDYHSVRLGTNIGDMRVVEDGITANDWVVVNGLPRARPGAKVTPEKAVMGAQENAAKQAASPGPEAKSSNAANAQAKSGPNSAAERIAQPAAGSAPKKQGAANSELPRRRDGAPENAAAANTASKNNGTE
jgi:multidrug efflux system membrane fusion protein